MCRVLGVSRAGFYAWERRAPSDRDLADAWLTEKIRAIRSESKGTYGARRVHADLRLGHGIRVDRKRVERLMVLAGISDVVVEAHLRETFVPRLFPVSRRSHPTVGIKSAGLQAIS